MVKLTIDGKEVTVTKGTSIMEAARTNGIDIPGFCYHPRLESFGACRVCMVHVTERGRTRDKFACAQPVGEGMDVVTKSDNITKYVKSVTEYLLVHHPLDCPVCDKSGECELQDVTFNLGLSKGRISTKRNDKPSVKNNPILEFNHNRCILCGRCTRVCAEVQGVAAIDFQKRGFTAEVGPPADHDLDCEFCGQCLSVCPVGAIQDQVFKFRGRPWELKRTNTTCTYCSVGCTLTLNSKGNEIVRITSNDEDGLNGGNLCSKGRFGFEFINSEKRLLQPLIKKDGKHVSTTWDEALELISTKFKEIKENNGAEFIGALGSEKSTNEDNYVLQKFFRSVIGTNRIDNMANLRAPYLNELILESISNGISGKSIEDVQDADLVVLFGTDITEELPVAGNIVRKVIKKKKASLVVANARQMRFKSEASKECNISYSYGSEIDFIKAIIKFMIEEDMIDKVKLETSVNESASFFENINNLELNDLLCEAGVTKEELFDLADCFENAERCFIFVGKELLNLPWGKDGLRSLMNLAYLTKHGFKNKDEKNVNIFFPREHNNSQGVNDMGVVSDYLPGYQKYSDSNSRAKFESKWGNKLSDSNIPNGSNIFDLAINGNLKALYIMGDNPVTSYIDGREVREAINKLDFVVVQDSFLHETACMADVVLPSITFAEKNGSFTNIGNLVQKINKAIEPLGESKSDAQILVNLAEKMESNLENVSCCEVRKEIKELANINLNSNCNDSEAKNESLNYSSNGIKYPCEFKIVELVRLDDNIDRQFPLILTTGSVMFHLGTYSHNSKVLNKIYSNCLVEINPADAKELNIFSGDTVEVISANSEIRLKAKVTKKSTKGMVFIPSSYEGVPVNILTEKNSVPRVKLIKIK